MKQTVLASVPEQSAAKMTEFQGWRVPEQFGDPAEEYHAVRSAAGLFDVGFLGRIEVTGAGAAEVLQRLFTRNITELADGTAVFGLFCNEDGGILDAALLFKLPAGKAPARFLITTSALRTDLITGWISDHAGKRAEVIDRSAETAHLALQGPQADNVLETLAGSSFKRLKQKRVREMQLPGGPALVSRTGFTGERGFELVLPAERAAALWHALLQAGKGFGVLPCGMASREMLRIETGYLLAGNELREMRTPVEAGLLCCVDLRLDFLGKDAIARSKAAGPAERMVGFELFDKGVPKPGGTIFSEIREIGTVTSGTHSISCRKDIGLGYVAARYAQPGQEIEVEVKDREVAARIVALPFVRKK